METKNLTKAIKFAETGPLFVQIVTGAGNAWLAGFLLLNTRIASVSAIFFALGSTIIYNLD